MPPLAGTDSRGPSVRRASWMRALGRVDVVVRAKESEVKPRRATALADGQRGGGVRAVVGAERVPRCVECAGVGANLQAETRCAVVSTSLDCLQRIVAIVRRIRGEPQVDLA